MGEPDIGRKAEKAAREVRRSLSNIDLEGIGRSIQKAVRDAGRALGFGRRERSPYIICEDDVDERVARKSIQGGISLAIGISLVCGGIAEVFSSPIMGVVLLGVSYGFNRRGYSEVRAGRYERRLASVLLSMADVLGKRDEIPLVELAEAIEVPAGELEALVAEAIDRGLIPEGHLDDEAPSPVLYLSSRAWEERNKNSGGESVPPGGGASDAAAPQAQKLPPEAQEVVDACAAFAVCVLAARASILDTEVLDSLDGILHKVARLSDHVRRHPETASQLRHMVTYYLPATAKLAEAYAELEGQDDGGGNADLRSTREELRETLAQVDEGLTRLADDLLRTQSWDLKSDMDVMRHMLHQDGLADE